MTLSSFTPSLLALLSLCLTPHIQLCYSLNCTPPKDLLNTSPLVLVNVILFGENTSLKTQSSWDDLCHTGLEWALNPMVGDLKEEKDPESWKVHRERWSSRKEGGKDGNDTVRTQVKPKMASNHQKLGRSKEDFTLKLLEIGWFCSHLILDFLCQKYVRINICFMTCSSWYFLTSALGNLYKLCLQFCFYKISSIYILISISSIDFNLAFILSLQVKPVLLIFLKSHREDKTEIKRKSQ